MKTVVVCCGAGMATSSILEGKVKDLLKRNGIEARVLKSTITQLPGVMSSNSVDLIIPSGMYQLEGAQVVSGMPYLTGIGVEKMEQAIVEALEG